MVVVTIDGPAGAGKSSAAKALARRLGFDFLDTGAMYRAVTWAALRDQFPLNDEEALDRLCEQLRLEMVGSDVLLNGENITDRIRDPQISTAASPVSAFAKVRGHLVTWQRQFAEGRNVVTEGRDQGSVVFPDAICKFFLDAQATVRAQRRFEELQKRGNSISYEKILEDQRDRDERDRNRAVAPLRQPVDAILIDSTSLALDHVVDAMEREVRRRCVLQRNEKTES